MDENPNLFKRLKDRYEAVVWLVVSVLLPLFAGLFAAWKVYIYPSIENSLRSILKDQFGQQISEVKTAIDADNRILEQIKHKFNDELDSTYYFSKTFLVKYSLQNAYLMEQQDPLMEFFYWDKKDTVLLFIWSSGLPATMQFQINGGPFEGLENVGSTSWTKVDITKLVHDSDPLNQNQYSGIGEGVYLISITPIPNPPTKRHHILKSPQKTSKPVPSEEGQKDATESLQKEETETELDVYALVIVRRSPLP